MLRKRGDSRNLRNAVLNLTGYEEVYEAIHECP